jgi:putative hydrolase of HD superfamily
MLRIDGHYSGDDIQDASGKYGALPSTNLKGPDLLKMTDTTEIDPYARKIHFILEIDRLQGIIRKTLLTDQSRCESAAEHSWHVALAALVLFDSTPAEGMDLARILKMLLVHDLVEIDAGDTFYYCLEQHRTQVQREQAAAERIFGLLPENQSDMLRRLWQEFEDRLTPEACFANAIDRLQPLLQAIHTEGQSWRQHRIRKDQVLERMQPIRAALPSLWEHVLELIDTAAEKGYLVK